VNPPLEEAAAVVVGAGAATAAAASEGADIVGAGPGGEVAWRDLGSVRRRGVAIATGTGRMRRWGWGFCALGGACVACVRERERERLCGLCLRLVLGSDRLFGLCVALLWKRSAMVQMGRHGRLGNGVL
jgi:hypothetical protein